MSKNINQDWYAKSFDAQYLKRYAHRNDAEAQAAVRLILDHADLPAWTKGLDLACGAGRHLAVLRKEGIDAIGGDLSAPLLKEARTRGLPVMRLDMRHVPLRDHSLDLVTNFFTAFGYFSEDDENFSVFREVRRVLKPGGYFLFDFVNRGYVVPFVERNRSEERREGEDLWEIERWISSDGKRVEKRQELLRDGKSVRTTEESVRLFSPDELRETLQSLGFQIAKEWGSYEGIPFAPSTSERFILLLNAAPA